MVTIKKCCAAADRFDTKQMKCVANQKNFPFEGLEPKILQKNSTGFFRSNKQINWQIKNENCDGFLYEDSFEINEFGKLFVYSKAMKNQYFNNFCVDIDSENGGKILKLCENFIELKKCCAIDERFEPRNTTFHCTKSDYMTDISDYINLQNTQNIRLVKNEQADFRSYKKLDLKVIEISFDEKGSLSLSKSFKDYCFEQLVDEWIALVDGFAIEEVKNEAIVSLSEKEIDYLLYFYILLNLAVLVLSFCPMKGEASTDMATFLTCYRISLIIENILAISASLLDLQNLNLFVNLSTLISFGIFGVISYKVAFAKGSRIIFMFLTAFIYLSIGVFVAASIFKFTRKFILS